MTFRLLLSTVLVTIFYLAFAQEESILNTDFNAIIPRDMQNLMSDDVSTRTINFYEVIYNDSIVDVRFLKSSEPQANELRFIISPPELGNYSKISTLVGFMYESEVLIKTLIWLKVENQDGKKRFYTDYNQDRNYKNDGSPITVRNTTTSLNIPFLMNGKKDFIQITVQKVKRKKNILKRLDNQPVIDLGLSAGSGKLDYSYDEFGYLANFTVKGIGASANYYIGPFVIGVRSSIQNSYFYATYEFENGMRTTQVNKDRHPLNKFQLGGSLALRVPISRTVEIQPIGTYGFSYYFNPKYYPNRFRDDYFELSRSTFYELGLRMHFIVGNERAIYLLAMRNIQEWEPSGISGSSPFESNHKFTRVEVGYSIGL